ncbi:MAG: helix-turn-helix domain-containing protein [Fibrobacter sp.]|nr:helix-turn-helix domain-containing protein [Fibrobacter sp.]
MHIEELATKKDLERIGDAIKVLVDAVRNKNESDEVLLMSEAAELIKMPLSTLKKKIYDGELASSKPGKERTVLKSDLMKFWRRYRVPSKDDVRNDVLRNT